MALSRPDIDYIASLLTDDPDIFCEEALPNTSSTNSMSTPSAISSKVGMGAQEKVDLKQQKPLNSVEISKQADEMTPGADASGEIAQQLKMQQDMEKEQQSQRQKLLTPQMDLLQQSMQKLNTGVLQGKQAATSGGQQFGNLEKEMVNLNTVLGSLENNLV